LGDHAIDGLLFPWPGVFTHLTARRKIGDGSREPVERGGIGRGRHTPHTPPSSDVASAQDLSALPPVPPRPAVIHAPAQPATQFQIAQMFAFQLIEHYTELVGVELAPALLVRFVDRARSTFEHRKVFACTDGCETGPYAVDEARVPL